MPIPTRAPSTRIPTSAQSSGASASQKQTSTATAQDQEPSSRRPAFPRRGSASQTGQNTSNHTASPAPTVPQGVRHIPRSQTLEHSSRPANATSSNHQGSDTRPISSHGHGASSLVRARSLRSAVAAASAVPVPASAAPPSSFKMPLRPVLASTSATGPIMASSNRGPTANTVPNAQRRTPSLGRSQSTRAKRTTSINEPSAPSSYTPRTEPRPRPLSASMQHGTQPKRPISASSNSTPVSASSRRPLFSAHQQHFTPTKTRPAATDSADLHTGLTAQQARQQMHLLHLSLLHEAAEPALSQYTASARSQLAAKHAALQDLYFTSLHLSRQARQQRNILALTQWTNGNTAVLERKLATLCAVLAELSRLTIPVVIGSHTSSKTDAPPPPESHELGPYAKLTEQFTAWVSYVLGVWEERDAATERERQGDIDNEQDEAAFTPIEGLGDGVKSSVRSLSDTVNMLRVRMEDVAATAIPLVPLPEDQEDSEASVKHEPSTPAQLISYASTLLDSMAEELQLMREIEFEVVIGEKAWVDERVRRAQADIEGGFGTPASTTRRAFRDVF